MQDQATPPAPPTPQPTNAGGALEDFVSAEGVKEMEQHSEVQESPQEKLERIQALKTQAQNDLQSISTHGSKDLEEIQAIITHIAEVLDLPQEEQEGLTAAIERDWQEAYDRIVAKIEAVEQQEEALLQVNTQETPQQSQG